MPVFDSDGVPIHYLEEGSGAPVMLVHGFGASVRTNWYDPGWIDYLASRYRVVALDCRGHGLSGKPHDSESYGVEKMGGDVIRLLDHLGIGRSLLMGYSMGSMISLHLVLSHPARFRALVLGGFGGGSGGMAEPGRRQSIAAALLAEDAESVSAPIPKMFRRFAEANGNDLKALAACMSHERPQVGAERLASIRMPVMLVVGTRDTLIGSAHHVADAIRGAQLVQLEGRDHINAVVDERYKEAVARFFASAPE